ncbi:MAG: hypothetical protein ACTSSN_04215 [Candidatus Heimdallarchaeaceae archaeon]
MKAMVKKMLLIIMFLQLLLFPSALIVKGEHTIISSRVSLISDITINSYPNFFIPDTTQFSLNATVEILNRDDKNQSVTESSDMSPKVYLNASFVNQSLGLEIRTISHGTIMDYSYLPGITVENHPMIFYINQTDLHYLPDGNYTFWRPIIMVTQISDLTPGEALIAIIHMNSGIMNITYTQFDYHPTEQSNFSIFFPLSILLLVTLVIYKNRKRKRITE